MNRIIYTIAVAVLLVSPAVAQAQQQVPTPVTNLKIIDANNKLVGPVIDAFSTQNNSLFRPTVALKVGPELFVLGVAPDTFIGTVDMVFFATTDCTGTPYFSASPTSGLPEMLPKSFVKNDGTLFGVDPEGPALPEMIKMNSDILQQAGFPGPANCEPAPNLFDGVIQAKAFLNLNSFFQPPFKLR